MRLSRRALPEAHSGIVVIVATVAVLWVAPAAASSSRRGHDGRRQSPFQYFKLSLVLAGEYDYHYTAPEGFDVQRRISFGSSPVIAFQRIALYPSGHPSRARHHVSASQEAGGVAMTGSWRIRYIDPPGEDSCEALGPLEGNPASPPSAIADFSGHGYSVTVRAAAAPNAFIYPTSDVTFGPCGVRDPWREWALQEGVPDEGAGTFAASFTVTQAQLRSVVKRGPLSVAIGLDPAAGLPSTDCGSVEARDVRCTRSLEWTGAVSIRRAPVSKSGRRRLSLVGDARGPVRGGSAHARRRATPGSMGRPESHGSLAPSFRIRRMASHLDQQTRKATR